MKKLSLAFNTCSLLPVLNVIESPVKIKLDNLRAKEYSIKKGGILASKDEIIEYYKSVKEFFSCNPAFAVNAENPNINYYQKTDKFLENSDGLTIKKLAPYVLCVRD